MARYSQALGVDEPLAMLRSSTASYYDADGLGSITSLTNSTGSLAQTYGYDSFGNQTSSSGSLTNSFQYTAREFDSETGLYYHRARYYDPQNGRFVSEDPIDLLGGINFYLYADDSPVGLKDPSGLDTYGWPIPGSSTPIPKPGSPRDPHAKKPYNCAAYALGNRKRWLQPDAINGTDKGLIPWMKQYGCTEVPCDTVESCGQRHRVNTYQDPINPWNWHVERQDCNGYWSGKNGQDSLVIGITNPDNYYQKVYGPVINPKKTCWSCKGN